MRALVLERFGNPADVLQVQDRPVPTPGPGQVRVRMIASPINPSDLLFVRGQYGRLPSLPATPGFEGVGVVESVGPGLLAKIRGLRAGRRVAVINGHGGNWQEQVVISARTAVPVADGLPDDQVASFFVNPASALVMTRYVLRVPAGAWLLQTAAGSALGRMVIRLGKHAGFRTINVVRRREGAEALRQLGGHEVIATDHESIEERVQQITDGAGISFALDAVGGQTGLSVLRALARNGRMLVYGTLSGEPIPVEPRQLMFGQRQLQGFWLSEWAVQQSMWTMLRLFSKLQRLIRNGVLATPVQATFPLEQAAEAIRLAETPGRQGKILFKIS